MPSKFDTLQHICVGLGRREGERTDRRSGDSKEKFWTITYADDIVLLAKREMDLEEMMKRFRRFLEKKGLSLSPDKFKII